MRSRKRRTVKTIALLILAILVMTLGCAIYLNDYYIADWESIEGFTPVPAVDVYQAANGSYVFAPEDAKTGFIFYPGGKVSHDAYIPLMECLAAEGILCVIPEMPYRLAVLDMPAGMEADRVLVEIHATYGDEVAKVFEVRIY